MADKKKKASETQYPHMSIGMCIGMSVGTAIGVALDNMPLWMAVGISVGMCIGLVIDSSKQGKSDDKAKNNYETGE